MSDSEATPRLRRSTREKKTTKLFSQDPKTRGRKRKRDTDDEGGNATDKTISDGLGMDEDREERQEEETEDVDDYTAPKTKLNKPNRTSGGTSEPKAKTKVTPTKKTRPSRPKGDASVRKPKPDASTDFVSQIKESHMSDDNALFLSLLNPSSTLQSVVEDFLDSLSNSPELALADLITCILRVSGCNEVLSSDEVVNLDGVVDTLDTYTDNLKQLNVPPYPLASKLLIFKKLRKQLSDFFHRLIVTSAELDSLYTSDLLPTLIPWVSTMSSSQLRSFRHTATVIAMELMNALCQVAAEVEKEDTLITRQREGEKKRAGKNKGKGRDKEFEVRAEEVRQRKAKLAEYIEDFFNGVFVHRYRDHDPGIRTECVQAMGFWFKSYPSRFLDGRYFRYVGWVLSDTDFHVRLAATKSLHTLYLSSEPVASIQTFTDRFKGRLVQMATCDLELSIRVVALQTLALIDKASLLEENQRDEICLLIYDEEVRVRKAIAGFVRNVWEEAIDAQMPKSPTPVNKQKEKERIGLKCMASLLVKWGKRTHQGLFQQSTGEEEEIDENMEDTTNRDVMRLVDAQQKGRIAFAVDALWDELPPVADWETLLDYLLLDHSASETNDIVGPSSRRVAKKMTDEEDVDDAWRLTETEESALLQLFVASLRKTRDEAQLKKTEGETTLSDMTRALIKALPRLFAKHQTDANRIADVLLIPPLMNLDMYLEMRVIPAYESLWDDVIKQFNSHSSPITLSHATTTIQHLMLARLLTNTNTTKHLELEEELSTSLRDVVAGREELEMADFSEDEIHKLGAITARLVTLSSVRDMTQWMEEDEGGKQSSAWDIMNALAGRGRLGLKEEELMIEECLRLLTLHLAWKSRNLDFGPDLTEDAIKYKEALEEQRNSVLEKMVEYAVGKDSKPCEGVKRAAFHNLLDLHILFNGAPESPPSALPLIMDDQTQYRCAGLVQAELEQFTDDLEDPEKDLGHTTDDGASRAGSIAGEEDGGEKKDGPKQRTGKEREDSVDPRMLPRTRLEREYILNSLLATFIRALRVGVLDPSHCAVVLAQYGRFGVGFDTTIKVVIDFLRDLGMFRGEGHLVSEIIVRALQESFNLFMDAVVHKDDHTVALARALTACFVIRGAQLSIVKRLEAEHVVGIQKGCLSWIVKRCAGYDAVKSKKLLRHAILFFRSLQQLLSTVESRDALAIKAHLDQSVAQVKLQIASTKIWDPYRSYEKRLTSIMQKDKSIPIAKGKRRKKGDKSGTDDEAGEGGIDTAGSATDNEAREPRTRPKPKPKPVRRRRASIASTGNEGDDEDVFGPVSKLKRTRSPSKRLVTQKKKTSQTVEAEEPEEPDTNVNGNGPDLPMTNGHRSSTSESPQRKRRRDDGRDSGEDVNLEPVTVSLTSQIITSVADTKSRRKRKRL